MSDSETEVKPVKLNKNGKPKKKVVMTPERLEKLALAREKYQEMQRANKSNTAREKELRKQEKELKLRKLIIREEKVKQLQEKVNGKKPPVIVDSDSEDDTAKREEALIAREKELEAIVVEEDTKEPEPVKKVKSKKVKVVVEESESSDSETEVKLTKRQLRELMNKKEKREPAAMIKPLFDFEADKKRPKPKTIINNGKPAPPVNNPMNDLYNNLFARA